MIFTPMNCATTTWRRLETPDAPMRGQAACQSPLGSSNMSIAASGGYTPTSLPFPMFPAALMRTASESPSGAPAICTPSNVATTAWRHHVCPYAPSRRESKHRFPSDLSNATSSPHGSSIDLASPANLWPTPTSSSASLSEAGSAQLPGILAPVPIYSRRWSVLEVNGGEGSPVLSPMNTAFIASSTASSPFGGRSNRSCSVAQDASPFFADFKDGTPFTLGSFGPRGSVVSMKGEHEASAASADLLSKLGA